ncbi:hypothetical protein H7J77_11760 [Mycolicibacillus parakoreensis]|uniref:PE-PGRS family protein n=1 Tax=Mycolicibacillus parakoreensis TaxID=1069221 RepID=A0ABY3TXQ9_9MYCO|nr:hypothetical protein [Mycolicibacillus parakoreensis]MCV7316213.1 hypothetical protein [Mycolicibacillus parakoreensis]ULN52463.1 hypothetical protein MIU77_16740 [Mycolicibacillus parakoreensis]
MDNALRPYLTAGIAVLGAGAIAVTPVAPTLPDIQIPPVQLMGAISDWVNGNLVDALDLGSAQLAQLGAASVYPELVSDAFNNIVQTGAEWMEHPFPILGGVLYNQIGYLSDFLSNPANLFDVPGQMLGNLENVVSTFGESGWLALALVGSGGPLASTILTMNSIVESAGTDPLDTLIAAPGQLLNAFLNTGPDLQSGLLPILPSGEQSPFDWALPGLLNFYDGKNFAGPVDGWGNFFPQFASALLTGQGPTDAPMSLNAIVDRITDLPQTLMTSLQNLSIDGVTDWLKDLPAAFTGGLQDVFSGFEGLFGAFGELGDNLAALIQTLLGMVF